MRRNFRIPSEEELRRLVTPENDRENFERLEITGVGDPSGRGLGFSYVRVAPKAPIASAAIKKKVAGPRGGSTVTGTDADLRRLSMDAARENDNSLQMHFISVMQQQNHKSSENTHPPEGTDEKMEEKKHDVEDGRGFLVPRQFMDLAPAVSLETHQLCQSCRKGGPTSSLDLPKLTWKSCRKSINHTK